jgi:hypothetical protein
MHTPQNYIFVCLKNHKGNIIVWIEVKKIGIFSINYKFYMLKAGPKIIISCLKHSNLKSGQSLFFSNVPFSTKCALVFIKIGNDFNVDY